MYSKESMYGSNIAELVIKNNFKWGKITQTEK